MNLQPNYINHIALVLDASGSMHHLSKALIKVTDNLVAHMATRSQELDQETRVTVYTFNSKAKCVVYDKDVLRLPSIATFYQPTGQTALIDTAILSQQDLALTATKYGDHAFLTYVLTDGQENASHQRSEALQALLKGQPDNWTVAVLVPDMNGKFEAKKFGFPADNIAIWDATTERGMTEAGATITKATDSFMTARATGVRGSKSLFTMDSTAVNAKTLAASGLKPLRKDQFTLIPVVLTQEKTWIRDFVQSCGLTYVLGRSYYQLTKKERIQAQKQVAIVHKKTAEVYVGHDARHLLGLPDTEILVYPGHNAEYDIYVQSTSVNRHLVNHTKLLVLS